MAFIPESHLSNLSKHKFNTTGYSHLDNVLNRFLWEPLVQTFPKSLAPNTVTVLGFVFMLFSYLTMLPSDHTFTIAPPVGVLIFSAFAQFMYQTLDACDGKQARRLGLSSPLGMLMDHGCDALSCTIIVLTVMQGLALGFDYEMLSLLAIAHTGFFLAQWEEYHTHYHRTHMFSWGVTEAQWTNIILLLLTANYTQKIWLTDIYGWPLRSILVYANAGWGINLSALMILNTISKTKPLEPLLRLVPMIMLDLSLYLWFINPLIKIYGPLILLMHGLLFAELNSKLIICSSAIMKFGWFHLDIAVELLFLIEDTYFKVLPSEVTFFILSMFIAYRYCSFVLTVVGQLTSYLKISVFSVGK